jgi:P4 family phage/plasmid primase-like protien
MKKPLELIRVNAEKVRITVNNNYLKDSAFSISYENHIDTKKKLKEKFKEKGFKRIPGENDCFECNSDDKFEVLKDIMKNYRPDGNQIKGPNNGIKNANDRKLDNNLNEMDENPHLIGCINGIYDLQRMEFREGRPDDLVTMSTKIDYDPEFNWADQRIKDIMEFISKVLPNQNVREYVLQIFASCLDGTAKQKKFYIFSGSGGNGKSKLIELLDKTLGDYSVRARNDLLTKKDVKFSKLKKLKNKRVITFQKAEEKSKINVDSVKELSGKKIEATPFIICNDRPELPYDDDDLWHCIRLIDFISRFVPDESDVNPCRNVFQIDNDISEKINTWGDAFFWILTEYYKKYRAAGSKIKDPEEVIQYTECYRKQNTIFYSFFNECIENSLNDRFNLNDAFGEYKAWFKENFKKTGLKPQKEDELLRYFTKKLGEPNQLEDGPNVKLCWLGYRLNSYYGNTTNSTSLINELD